MWPRASLRLMRLAGAIRARMGMGFARLTLVVTMAVLAPSALLRRFYDCFFYDSDEHPTRLPAAFVFSIEDFCCMVKDASLPLNLFLHIILRVLRFRIVPSL